MASKLCFCVALAVLSSNLFADSLNVWTVTENSSTQATIDFRLAGTSYPFTLLSADTWLSGRLPFTFPCAPSSIFIGFCGNYYGHVTWTEAENPLRYNALVTQPNGPLGITAFSVLSDLTGADLAGLNGCGNDFGGVACPTLTDGQSFDVPLSHYDALGNLVSLGSMTMTFQDRGDVLSTAPEPQGMLLLLTGMVVLGGLLRRRSAGMARD